MVSARQYLQIDGSFEMQRGVLQSPRIAYETWGQLNFSRSFTVVTPLDTACVALCDILPGTAAK